MPETLRVPLKYRTLKITGEVLLRADLDLLVCSSEKEWSPFTFRVDSGTEMTTLPAFRAKQYRLPYPKEPLRGLDRGTAAGKVTSITRSGLLQIKIPGLDETEYWLPCYFEGDPDTELDDEARKRLPPNLLGLTGVVDKLRITFDGTPGPEAPFGFVIVERLPPPSSPPPSAPEVPS
jgi:hypothetical protein